MDLTKDVLAIVPDSVIDSASTRDDCSAAAYGQGLVPFFDTPDLLLLDIDLNKGFKLNERELEVMKNRMLVQRYLETISKSGNRHYYIKLSYDMPLTERAAFQALLGSDPMRELLTLTNDQNFYVLYETPLEAHRVMAFMGGGRVEDDDVPF